LKKFIQLVLRRNAYFILAAAWLFTISFITTHYWSNYSSVRFLRNSIEKDIQRQEKDFLSLVSDSGLVNKLVSHKYNRQELENVIAKRYAFYLYETNTYGLISLAFWNNQYTTPAQELLQGSRQHGFVKLSSGQYEFLREIVQTKDKKQVVAVCLIPIRKEYFIQNPNLKPEFANHPKAENKVAIARQQTDYPVKSSFGDVLFYLEPKMSYQEDNSNWFTLTLNVLAIIFLLIFIHNAGIQIAESYGYMRGIFFLVSVVVILRALTYLFPQLLNLGNYELFDPAIYSSGIILNSLGDLLINAFLFCWIILFVRSLVANKTFEAIRNTKWHWPVLALVMLSLVGITFVAADIIKSLIADARISFDVTNFFRLTIYSFVGFLVLATISFGYFFCSRLLLTTIEPLIRGKRYLIYILLAFLGLLVLSFFNEGENLELNIYVLVWLLAYVYFLKRRVFSGLYFRYNISDVLFWLFVFSVSISVIIIYENRNTELQERKTHAEKLSTQADPSSERLISIALTYIDDDFLIDNFQRFAVPSSNAYLKDSLINKNFSAYINKFDTRIYTFDAQENPLHNVYTGQSFSYDALNTIFRIKGQPTSVNNLRYFEEAYDKFSYLFKKEVRDTINRTVGYLFILCDRKGYSSDALIPELFRQSNEYQQAADYSYAVYNDLALVDYDNNYRFPTRLTPAQVPKKEFVQKKRNGYDELWYREDNDTVVILAKKDNYLIEAITLFSWIFTSFLILVALFRIISLVVKSRLKWSLLKQHWQFNLRSQIHGTIIFISLFSFLVIGIATIIFFYNRYQKNNQDRLSKTIQIMSNDLQNKIRSNQIFYDLSGYYEASPSEDLENIITHVAEIHGTDINIYDLNGDLKITSNVVIYSKGILSKKMNPLAFYYMNKEHLIQFVNQERMGNLEYQSIYSPVRDEDGKPYAYLNIPYFVSEKELQREISNFLVTIINLNAFIFLIAGVIALFITNRITSSFLLIGDKMREINLGKLNEVIRWERDDEIGGLVKEYNKMVTKLEESAAALAKSEREGAWREMARQVAHEIKNPLTPMKLSIQYLQKAINNNSENVKELSSNVARTLIEQIDHLSKIAADFSQFANIGNVKNEIFDLHDILSSLAALYESTEHLEFRWAPLPQRILILADKTQLNRLFTNLFQNAVEACYNNDEKVLEVTEELREDHILIKITDNGHGIPEEMQSKIFTPNFTTKSSGTGLGLAMSKTIVEHARGRIWFETKAGEGTTFFVELPVVRSIRPVSSEAPRIFP
jgi:two-component system, NtrC family, nitrogen regulation sensor histidine kinase NtrY